LILTSQGIPFLHAGQDFLRTKYGDHNSYRSPDRINRLDWARKAAYLEVFRYYQGLIALRRAHPAFRMVSAAQIQKHLQFLDLPPEGIGYLLTGHANQDPWETIAVLFNAGQKKLEVALPGDEWVAVVDGKQAGTKEIWRIHRSSTLVPPRSAQILVDAKSYDRSLKGE
jgi:pullulanase